MSNTEIFGFDKEGNAYLAGEVKNAFRGAMAIWRILEEKYLPPIDNEYTQALEKSFGIKYSRCSSEDTIQEVWALQNSDKLSIEEKIVLFSTFDKMLVKKEDIPKVINAFISFEGETSLKEQAEILQDLLESDNCIAVGWNENSVVIDNWVNYSYDEENDRAIPYNCLKQNEHYWLFDELIK